MTSIEWLIDQMFKQGYFDGNKPLTFTNLDHLQQQAVEMHKEEIKNAWDNRNKDVIKSDGKTSEQYYNETYGSKGSDDHIVYTNDIKKLIKQAHFDGQYLHSNLSKLLTNEMLDDNAEYYSNEIIQSLKP